jgi:hypothetical protein
MIRRVHWAWGLISNVRILINHSRFEYTNASRIEKELRIDSTVFDGLLSIVNKMAGRF